MNPSLIKTPQLIFVLVLIFYKHSVNPNTNSLSEKITANLNITLASIRQLKSTHHQPIQPRDTHVSTKNNVILCTILLLCGDIEINPGPRNKTINPCRLCDRPVTWSCEGICCDDCSVWHHRSCIELCSHVYKLLQWSHVQWMCCKCDTMNVDSFTYRSFEL